MKFELIPCPQEPEYWNLIDSDTGQTITECATQSEVLGEITSAMRSDEYYRRV